MTHFDKFWEQVYIHLDGRPGPGESSLQFLDRVSSSFDDVVRDSLAAWVAAGKAAYEKEQALEQRSRALKAAEIEGARVAEIERDLDLAASRCAQAEAERDEAQRQEDKVRRANQRLGDEAHSLRAQVEDMEQQRDEARAAGAQLAAVAKAARDLLYDVADDAGIHGDADPLVAEIDAAIKSWGTK